MFLVVQLCSGATSNRKLECYELWIDKGRILILYNATLWHTQKFCSLWRKWIHIRVITNLVGRIVHLMIVTCCKMASIITLWLLMLHEARNHVHGIVKWRCLLLQTSGMIIRRPAAITYNYIQRLRP